MVDLPRVAAILQRIAADVDELARARRVADLGAAAALPDRRAERRRRTWTSGSSAAAASCPNPSAPGTCSPMNVTSAAKPTFRPIRHTTRSGTTSRARTHDPCPCNGVQQTGRPKAVPGAVLTGTPIRHTTRSGTTSRGRTHDPCPCNGVQQTGRPKAVPGAVLTGTPCPVSGR